MLGFIVRRLVSAALVVVLTSMFVFTIFYEGPSDPAQDLCYQNGKCTAAKEKLLEHEMQLDIPLVKAYGQFVGGLFHGRTIFYGAEVTCPAPCLGISYGNRQPVTKQLFSKYPPTLLLAIGGAAIYLVLGVVLGVVAARFRGSWVDRLLMSLSLVVSSIPYYLVALFAWIFLTLKLTVFPSDGADFSLKHDIGGSLWLLALPWLCIGLTSASTYARFSRGQMVETLNEDYIRTAQAKGVQSRGILFKHALRAAIVPVITIFGLDFATLLAGTIYTEQIFDIDGVGNWGLQALRSPTDFPVLTATVLLSAILVVLANLVVDILYGSLDPRVRIG